MSNIIIAGFSSTDKVPGAYGENKWGAGAQSAASIPLLVLLVGLAGTGATADLDDEIVDIFDPDTAATKFGARSELADMCRAALDIPGVTIKAVAPTGGGGAKAALTITLATNASADSTYRYEVAGRTFTGSIPSGSTPTQAAVIVRDHFLSDATLPMVASSAAGVVTLTVDSAGIRGNQYILRQDTSEMYGMTSTLAGGTPLDSGGVPFSGGTGTESYTNLLATLRPSGFDRVALACNDATSLADWEAQADAQAGPLEGLFQQFILALNGTQSAAQSLASTTLNNPLFQPLWCLNSEAHPSVLAAQFAAIRSSAEQADPCAAYDDVPIPAGVAQQRRDWPNHAQLVAALNNGVTPLKTGPDGKVRVVRSITSKCLNGASPDYSTLDTSEVSVPQFVLRDLKVYWVTVLLPGNPRTAADPADGERPRPAGILTPSLTAAEFEGKLRDYEQGNIGGRSIAPIIIDVDSNKPVADYDGIADRIMVAVPTKVAPANHQIGISVRQI